MACDLLFSRSENYFLCFPCIRARCCNNDFAIVIRRFFFTLYLDRIGVGRRSRFPG